MYIYPRVCTHEHADVLTLYCVQLCMGLNNLLVMVLLVRTIWQTGESVHDDDLNILQHVSVACCLIVVRCHTDIRLITCLLTSVYI